MATIRERIAAGEGLGLPLSPREIMVIRALLSGLVMVREIGLRVGCSHKMVSHHLYFIYAKTGAANMTDLALMCAGYKPRPANLDVLGVTMRKTVGVPDGLV